MLVCGFALVTLASLELSLREHFSGYRSHSALLAGAAAVIVDVPLFFWTRLAQEILLAVVGGLFVLEALSVILQVGSFKLRGKRVFKMAPIHHHFELAGVAEPKIIVRFWIVSILCAALALMSLKLR